MITAHKLPFEACEWPRDPNVMCFRVGTCEGQWFCTDLAYCILTVMNSKPGNGHLEDVFQWFEFSCKRDKKALMVLELMNDRFKKHCIQKRGFHPVPGTDNLIKII